MRNRDTVMWEMVPDRGDLQSHFRLNYGSSLVCDTVWTA